MKKIPKTYLLGFLALLLTCITVYVGSRLAKNQKAARQENIRLRQERDSLAQHAYQAERRYALLLLKENQHQINHFNHTVHEIATKAAADSLAYSLPSPDDLWPTKK